ncbi:RNA polymerase sigma-70 factor [Bordetella sp. N]|uniref:RNA polymerase sigma-70 factor n=1 Tax=Bordetella sp. N TaxID=1746199 RepID=UPI0007099E91|nr:RNA polymerase sigma-70 factor [Bordetella sp. N]ALM86245.1 RNA polymerase subunit sigma-24 [Bordetella sp. N]
MDHHDDTYTRLRPRLQGIAYRMLGSLAEAEDVVQDAWLRWHAADVASLDNAEAWLVTVTTRLAIDRLRVARQQREHYPGFWLPEPLLTDPAPTPEELHALSDDLSVAFLNVLERLSPEARAAFLLHDVFDADYAEVARILDKTEEACRQMVARARVQVREGRTRYTVTREAHQRVISGFAHAMRHGDLAGLAALLAEDARLVGDGGGKVPSFPKPLVGGDRIAQLFYAAYRRLGPAGLRVETVMLNGRLALLRFMEGQLESAQSFETDGNRIVAMQVQRNPDKLARLLNALAASGEVFQ